MKFRRIYSLILCAALSLQIAACQAQPGTKVTGVNTDSYPVPFYTGADMLMDCIQRFHNDGTCPFAKEYLLGDVKVAVVGNQTSLVATGNEQSNNKSGSKHLVDTLLASGVNVVKIFCPEHGFRGNAEAGAHVGNSVDSKTGLPIVSLYGNNKKPTPEQMKGIDLVIFDLQDVGCRFYTYISTLHYVMEACAENNVRLIVLDRPNPNGHYIDGPVLDMKYQSFIGMHPVPIVYGLTIGEYACMINGEGWLKGGVECDLTVVPMQGYCSDSSYVLPVPPSPNLQTPQSIALYPSLCLFEGTNISVGRGTKMPFEIIGSPDFKVPKKSLPGPSIKFTPQPIKGVSENPPFKGQQCSGLDLRKVKVPAKFDLTWLKCMYENTPHDTFFKKTNGFEKLAGTDQLRKQLQQGLSEEEIRASWEPALSKYKQMCKKYLIYHKVVK